MGRGGSEDAAPVAEAGASAAAATEPEQNTAAQAAQENEEKVSDLLPARESKKTTTANTNTKKKNQAAMVFDIKPRRFTHTLSFFFLSCLHLGLTPNLSKRWRAKGVRKKRKRSSATQTT